jgi:anti-sigma factor (TIGR02949 family)
MTQTRFGEQACQKVLARLDSYIDNELLTESSLELMEHFQRCTACTRESQERRNVRARLQTAVREVRVPPGLEDRVRDRLRQTREPGPKRFHLMAIAATLAVCLGSWVAYQLGALRLTTASQEQYVAAISGEVASIIRVGLGDHLHCALLRQRGRRSEGGVDKLPTEFKELIPIVHQHIPADLPLILAHECRYHGRNFVHLTFQNGRSLLSLVIAKKQDGESLDSANLLPALPQSGIPMYTAGASGFQVAAFESRVFLVYTVSDLSQTDNLGVLAALAPSLQNFLNQMVA